MPDLRAALLQEFVRLQIPQDSETVNNSITKARRSSKARYLWALRDLKRRKAPRHPKFLNVTQFRNAVKELTEEYERDKADIATNPQQPHFQSWRATDADWRTLAIGLALERAPASYVQDEETSRTGDDHWYFDIVMGNVVKETGGNVRKAATIAAKYINGRIDAGEFTRQSAEKPKAHVEAETLRTFYEARSSTRSKSLAKMLPDSLDAFISWTRSPECPISLVTAMLPLNEEVSRWVRDDALGHAEEDRLSSWGRLQAHFDGIASAIDSDVARKTFQATRQALVTGFHRHRHALNGSIMAEEVISEPPSYIRHVMHIEDRWAAAVAAADSLSEKCIKQD